MIEMLGVLAIIGVLSVGGIAGYSKAMHRYRINKTIEQITLIAGNIRSFFAPQRNYKGLSDCRNDNNYCKLIKKAKLMPDEMWDDTDKRFKNVFGQVVYLYAENKSTTDEQAFRIDFNLTENEEEACIDLLSQDWTNAGVNLFRLVGGPVHNKYLIPPIDVATVVKECSTAFGNGYNPVIVFFFDINVNSTYWQRIINP